VEEERTKEVRIEVSTDPGRAYRQVLAQDYTFSPQGATFQHEDSRLDLTAITHLKLTIVPNKGGSTTTLICACTSAGSCPSAQQGERAIVEEVQADPDFAPHRAIAASAGFRAVFSTPITSRQGELLGVLSAHFRAPHRPPERALRMVDLYARQAAEFLERMKIEGSLKEADRRKSEFLAILAHELRNPLAPIRNGLQILRLAAFADEPSGIAPVTPGR
jgi:GAF domain-containing protein